MPLNDWRREAMRFEDIDRAVLRQLDDRSQVGATRDAARAQAADRARREGRAMLIYYTTEQRPNDQTPQIYWYVRPSDEAAPDGASIYEEVTPHE